MLKSLEINGFKSFAKKSTLDFQSAITSIVGPNGSGKSNVVEAVRFVLGEQSMKSLRGKGGADLIFKGSKSLAKSNRAAVTITFDNRNRVFVLPSLHDINLDFEEVSITREVLTSGANRYLINGSEVRLKDIVEMLSSVNIGSSGHHIISQGEADRILNSSAKERRGMIEDALGLRLYQYRIRESERKLEKTRENMKEVSLLRKEIAPHLKFLRSQVEKLEKAAGMRIELGDFYKEYLKREEIYIRSEKEKLGDERKNLEAVLKEAEKASAGADAPKAERSPRYDDISKTEKDLAQLRGAKDELSRKLGRLEGMIEMSQKSPAKKASDAVVFSSSELRTFVDDLEEFFVAAEEEENLAVLKDLVVRSRRLINNVIAAKLKSNSSGGGIEMNKADIDGFLAEKNSILADIEGLDGKEAELRENISALRKLIAEEEALIRERDKASLELSMRKREIVSKLEMLSLKEENIAKQAVDFENEIREGSALVGPAVVAEYKNFQIEAETVKAEQEDLKKKIEKIKVRLEDIGAAGGGDFMKEYEEVSGRDQFLARELEDLNKSIDSLEALSKELKEKLDVKFREGIEKINGQFEEFFKLMFGGGAASLKVSALENKIKLLDDEEGEDMEEETDEDEEAQYGIDINVSLPHKKVKELHALSGGERSLTSIALLFAMSQVNPPPFLILDETDAALDEANSRKYGDMLERLAKYSQLVVVTHNRETMSRASTLYGVTVGSDGASKLLSIKFDEAVAIAK
jgi:chromosome segregation ATPase